MIQELIKYGLDPEVTLRKSEKLEKEECPSTKVSIGCKHTAQSTNT